VEGIDDAAGLRCSTRISAQEQALAGCLAEHGSERRRTNAAGGAAEESAAWEGRGGRREDGVRHIDIIKKAGVWDVSVWAGWKPALLSFS
jgi:hypothetical protein